MAPNSPAFLLNSPLQVLTPPPGPSRASPAIRKEVLGERHPDYATSLEQTWPCCSRRRGTTPPPGHSMSKPWRSVRTGWASTTPTMPGA